MNRLVPTALAAALLVACATSSHQAPVPSHATPPVPLAAASKGDADRLPVGSVRSTTKLSFEEGGKLTRTVEERYVILSASPEGYFGQWSVEYDPLQQDPPELEATVTLPDGSVRHLDKATIVEGPASSGGPDNLSDRRRLVAPLPGLIPGSVVERRSVSVVSRPVVDFGQSHFVAWAYSLPLEEASIVVDHPVGLHLAIHPVGMDTVPTREEIDGRIRHSWRGSDIPAWLAYRHAPPEARDVPGVHVSTARSWQDVARGYHRLITSKIEPGAVASVAGEIRKDAKEPGEVLAAALGWMHHHLRYTGLDLSNAGIVPNGAADTLQRGYGDCKDLAALLVSLLQASGIEARIALVSASSWSDAPADIPGIGRFDHAIVYVPGPRPIWVDPTLRGMPPGALSDYTVDKIALVIDPATTAPIRTPLGRAEDNRVIVHTEITLPEYGPGQVRLERIHTGTAMSWHREWAFERTGGAVPAKIADEVQRMFGSDQFEYSHTDPLDARVPFRQIFEIRDSERADSWDGGAAAPLGFAAIRNLLPWYLVEDLDNEDEEPDVSDLFVGAPASVELVTKIRVPPQFVPTADDLHLEDDVGGIRWSLRIAEIPDGVEARLDFRIDKRNIAAADLPAARRSLRKLLSSSGQVRFQNRIFQHVGAGQIVLAESELRRLEGESKSPWLEAIRARVALAAGLGLEARRIAKEAARVAPDSPPILRTLALILAHDPLGRLRQPGMAREEAIRTFSRVLELEPNDTWSQWHRIALLARDDRGAVGGPGSDAPRALDELRKYRKSGETDLDALYHRLLFLEGLDDELIGESQRGAPEALVVAALARRDGLEAALSRFRKSRKVEVAAEASLELLKARAYPLAYGIAREVKAPQFTMLTNLLKDSSRRDERPLDLNDPRDVFVESAAWAIGATTRVDAAHLGLTDDHREGLAATLLPILKQLDSGPDVLLDVIASIIRTTTEEIPGLGVLVESHTPFAPNAFDLLVRTPKGLALHPAATPAQRVEQAWIAWREGDLDRVRVWLKLLLQNSGESPTGMESFFRSKMAGSAEDLAQVIALIHHPIPGFEKARREAIERAFTSLPNQQGAAIAIAGSWLIVLMDEGRYDEALAVIGGLVERGLYPDDSAFWADKAQVLIRAGRLDELEAWARTLVEENPRSERAWLLTGHTAQLRGDHHRIREVFSAMADAGIQRELAFNNIAWSGLYLGVEDRDIQLAELALGPAADNRAALDTLAVLLAEKGEVDRALTILERLQSLSGEGDPISTPYTRARIAELLGFRQAALELYEQVPATEGLNDLRPLAQQKLSRLKAPSGRPAAIPAAATR